MKDRLIIKLQNKILPKLLAKSTIKYYIGEQFSLVINK